MEILDLDIVTPAFAMITCVTVNAANAITMSIMEIFVTTVIVEMFYVLANVANVLTITTSLVLIPIALHAVVTYIAAKINVTNVSTIISTILTISTILEVVVSLDSEAITKMVQSEGILVPKFWLLLNTDNECIHFIH